MIVALLATTASMRAGQPTEFDSSQFGVNIRRVDGMSKKPDATSPRTVRLTKEDAC